jgi:hypothetical protein
MKSSQPVQPGGLNIHRVSSWPGVVPAIHVFPTRRDVDARHKAGHDALVLLHAF